jgi:hypothetical protein
VQNDYSTVMEEDSEELGQKKKPRSIRKWVRLGIVAAVVLTGLIFLFSGDSHPRPEIEILKVTRFGSEFLTVVAELRYRPGVIPLFQSEPEFEQFGVKFYAADGTEMAQGMYLFAKSHLRQEGPLMVATRSFQLQGGGRGVYLAGETEAENRVNQERFLRVWEAFETAEEMYAVVSYAVHTSKRLNEQRVNLAKMIEQLTGWDPTFLNPTTWSKVIKVRSKTVSTDLR